MVESVCIFLQKHSAVCFNPGHIVNILCFFILKATQHPIFSLILQTILFKPVKSVYKVQSFFNTAFCNYNMFLQLSNITPDCCYTFPIKYSNLIFQLQSNLTSFIMLIFVKKCIIPILGRRNRRRRKQNRRGKPQRQLIKVR